MDKYAVFGNPIVQSKSPLIHRAFAGQTQQELSYEAIFAEEDKFKERLNEFLASGGKGCNVTMPFKQQAFQLADKLSERAQLAEAVNTLTVDKDGKLLADNTDGAGLVADFHLNNVNLRDARILLIGAGGAARGVLKPLLDEKPEKLVICNRTLSKAQALAQRFASFGRIEAEEFSDIQSAFDIVINSTSTSLTGGLPPVSAKIFSSNTVAYDMVYSDSATRFNIWANDNGVALTLDGLGMLVGQAAESFLVWRGVKPEIEPVIKLLRN
ncbi:shikimate dehydrogenase [Catenovulum sediminis]|uniref:Shikimate dehydrogenase (NADP(+)) n=1 Tax=Catenovulum sediminis TaxID=1740262 RepID=A0ABV1RE16_9ALTE|nr:shikimate dehydrogenase [Catenovulum sediminis]